MCLLFSDVIHRYFNLQFIQIESINANLELQIPKPMPKDMIIRDRF